MKEGERNRRKRWEKVDKDKRKMLAAETEDRRPGARPGLLLWAEEVGRERKQFPPLFQPSGKLVSIAFDSQPGAQQQQDVHASSKKASVRRS